VLEVANQQRVLVVELRHEERGLGRAVAAGDLEDAAFGHVHGRSPEGMGVERSGPLHVAARARAARAENVVPRSRAASLLAWRGASVQSLGATRILMTLASPATRVAFDSAPSAEIRALLQSNRARLALERLDLYEPVDREQAIDHLGLRAMAKDHLGEF